MSADRFVFKMYQFLIIAERREKYPYVPFIFNVRLERISTDCEFFLPVETVDNTDDWGYHFPACNHDDLVNQNAVQINELHTCVNCPLYKEGDPLDLSSLRGSSDPDKAARRKARRLARQSQVEEPEEDSKAARRKARREARKAAAA